MGKLTDKKLEIIEELFDNEALKLLYGGNIHSYIKEVEEIEGMSEEEARKKYPIAFYWLDKWNVKWKKCNGGD